MNDEMVSRREAVREIQLAGLELIRLFVDICEKERLTYYMLGGTMLGAVRHKGYIPWDDDADFGMPRRDYEAFLGAAERYLTNGAWLSTFDGGEQYKYFARLLNGSRRIKIGGVLTEHESNPWIDIFPLDGMPAKRAGRFFHKLRLLTLRKLFLLSNFDKDVRLYHSHRTWYDRAGVFICRHIPLQRLFSGPALKKQLDRALMAYPCESSDYYLNLLGAYKFKEMFRKTVFGEGAFYDFEGMRLCGPADHKTYLTQLYGDYMTLPSEAERWYRHNTELTEDGS